MLIGMSFVFGHALAHYEAPGEIESNNESMSNFFNQKYDVENISKSIVDKYQSCLEEFQSSSATTDNLVFFMDECTKDVKEQNDETTQEIIEVFHSYNELTFNWATCYINPETGTSFAFEQSDNFMLNYQKTYNSTMEKYIEEGQSEDEAHTNALLAADGANNQCGINTVGGATFWFTIMTTIGYGNATVTSTEGRLLVLFLGFLSIMVFSTLIGHAGYIMLTIVDHFFRQHRMKRFTKGLVSVIFWFAMLLLWLGVIMSIYQLWTNLVYSQVRDYVSFTWFDAFWFAYISVTTIGFGDFYIPPDSARVYDMFMTPLIILIGFVLLANFILKFSDFIRTFIPSSSDEDNVEEAVDNNEKRGEKKVYDLSGENNIRDPGLPSDVAFDEALSFARDPANQLDDEEVSFDTEK